MVLRSVYIIWIFILPSIYNAQKDFSADIGYSCQHDTECRHGNGGAFSKCHQGLHICICTINHLGEDKCQPDSYKFEGVCRPRSLYTQPGYCSLECSPRGTIKWTNRDWYGIIRDPFAVYVHDKQTSVCYDPQRAVHSLPDGFDIKSSTIPGAGLGAFTKVYVPQDTIIGPYKGTFEPDSDTATVSGYSWKIDPRENEGRYKVEWVDAKDVALSNWLRYGNTPTNANMENLIAFQYKGEMFYQAFKPILPGTELLVWYGNSYGEFLNIEPFDSPSYYSAKPGYAGGSCDDDDEGLPCLHDENTVCADKTCFCVAGTHMRAGKCIRDETLGGMCSGSNGETCRQDLNAECDRGVCVCKKNSIPTNGFCASDESFGGRCRGRDGQVCMRDDNAECVRGLCTCKYGATGIGKKCLKDEMAEGRCAGSNGEKCEDDKLAICMDNVCVCKKNTSAINGSCVLDESFGGRCRNGEGAHCLLDKNSICLDGVCQCRSNASLIDEKCRIDGVLGGVCIQGHCLGKNVNCDSMSNVCKCKATHFPYAGKCVKK